MKTTAYLPAFLEILQASEDLDGLLEGALRYIVDKYHFSLGLVITFEPIARHAFYQPPHLQPRLDPVKVDALCEDLKQARDFRQIVEEENEERFDLVLGRMLGDGKEKFLLFPLVAEEEIVGFLSLARQAGLAEPGEAERSYLSVMVRQIVMELSRELVLQKEKQLAREGAFLLEMGKAIIADLDLEEVLSRIVRASLELLEVSRCTVFILGEDKQHPQVLYSHDPNNPADLFIKEMMPGLDFHGEAGRQVFLEGKTVYVEDALTDPRANNETARLFDTISPLGIPLIYQGEVIGAIYIDEPGQYHYFSEEDIRIMEGIAAIAAIAVENARLYRESRDQQVRLADLMLRLARAREEERSRISRELHDSMAQTLLEIIYRAEGLLGTATGDHLQQELRGMLQSSRASLAELRRIITDLRPSSVEVLGLSRALANLLERFAVTYHLQVDKEIDEGLQLDSLYENSLFRIVQEALNNISRHASAARVSFSLRRGEGSILLEISDDGSGFDTASVSGRGGLGLIFMRERAEMMGGSFAIDSRAGRGTTLTLEVPLPPEMQPA